jgi:hypothetical protein
MRGLGVMTVVDRALICALFFTLLPNFAKAKAGHNNRSSSPDSPQTFTKIAQKATPTTLIYRPDYHRKDQEKYANFMIEMAADNDLAPFAGRNIKQLESIGSNENINIIVDLHIKLRGQKISKKTKLYN